MVCELTAPHNAAHLFEGWPETLIWSCLQNVMGHIYADSSETPVSAMALLGDFCFLAGEPCLELVEYKPASCSQDFIIMVPQNVAWARMIEAYYAEKAKPVTRYAIKKEPGVFNENRLQNMVNALPGEYNLRMMDEDLFCRCREIPWCRDWVAQFRDFEMYQKHGLGVVVLKDENPVSGASSYSGYQNGIEIEIDTLEEYRRRGLASVCGAKLILECLKRGCYPSWDAQNKASVALAEKLGYHFDHAYQAYEIWGY